MRIFKRCSAFLSALLISILLFDFLLSQPSVMKILISETKKNNCDTIFVGYSHGETDINPYIIDNELGCNSYNLSRRLTPTYNLYYIIKDCNSNNTIKRVFYELDYTYLDGYIGDKGEDGNGLKYLSPKLIPEYFINEQFNKSFSKVLFDYGFDKTSVSRIPQNIRIKSNKDYIRKNDEAIKYINNLLGTSTNYDYIGKGFRFGKNSIYNEEEYTPYIFNKENIDEHAIENLKKAASYCKENDIELICVNYAVSPYRINNENHGDAHDYFCELCNELDVLFIDFNYAKQDYLPRDKFDFVDVDSHMMGVLAEKQTKLLCEILSNNNRDLYFYDDYQEVKASFL